jgi:hypothetical protein
MTNPNPLTRYELKAAAYFAVGVTSEGSIGGRDVSNRLSFAGHVTAEGLMQPVGNSGYSFGTLQIDLGAHPAVAKQLLDQYQQWTLSQPDRATLHLDDAAYDATLHALQRNGRAMRAAHAHDIDRAGINRFLASDTGRGFVHGLDRQHAESITHVDAVARNGDGALERLQRTALYRDATTDDQARLAALFMKLENQAGTQFSPRLLGRIEHGELGSASAVKRAIDGVLPNQANGDPDYVQSGADNTLRGIALFNTLRSARSDNPLVAAWASVLADPLAGSLQAHAHPAGDPARGAKYDTIRSLFLTPEASQRLVHALDNGVQLAEGDPAPHHGRRRPGFFVSGRDFVHWNANGQGVACIGGQWRHVDPDHLRKTVQRDGRVELTLVENGRTTELMHVQAHPPAHGRPEEHPHRPEHAPSRQPHSANAHPHSAPPAAPAPHHHSSSLQPDAVRDAQAALAHLGYTGRDGRLLAVDGGLGANSNHALTQFQRDHGLPVTGRLDSDTHARLAAAERTLASTTHPANALFRQALTAGEELDRRMGIPGGPHTVALAGVAAAEAARAGLTRIDRVEIGADRAHVQAVQFVGGVDQWATNRTSGAIDVGQAVRQPLEVSSQQAEHALRDRQSVEQRIAQERAPMRAPVL